MNNIRFFNPGASYLAHKQEFDSEMQRVLEAGDLILRNDVEIFEKRLAEYVGTKYAIALNSCTDALYLALKGLDIGPGDEVLVPSRTFVASVQVILQVGATPVYYDLDGILDFTDNTRAIIPVHIEGAFDNHFERILWEAKANNIHVIEDAAQALGATLNGQKAGSYGIAGAFSFYPAKTLGAFGDAGALVTNDTKLYEWVRDARNHFKEDARDWGVNSRLDNLQAAVLNIKFTYYAQTLARRKEIADMYLDTLKEIKEIRLPKNTEGRIWQDFIIKIKDRDDLYNFLKENQIETLKNNYPFPVPKLPLAQRYEDETLRLPCNENLTDEEIEEVISKIKGFYEKENQM